MGNDGGSIPTRRELVKEAARNPTTTELKATQTESQAYHWTHDPLTRQALSTPIVSDSNGRLYNKDSILEFLLPAPTNDVAAVQQKEEAEKVVLGAVKSLKDVVEIRFEVEKEAKDGQAEVWRCPITSSVLGPGSKAVYLVPCGHAFSGTAIKEVGGEGSRCLVCEADFAQNDVVPILSMNVDEIARLTLRVKTLREKGLTHSLKKAHKEKSSSKKRKKGVEEIKVEEHVIPELVQAKENKVKIEAVGTPAPRNGTISALPKPKDPATLSSSIRNSGTASLTAKVMAEQEKNKKRRLENENLKSLFSNRDPSKPHGRSGDFMTRGFDIPASAKR